MQRPHRHGPVEQSVFLERIGEEREGARGRRYSNKNSKRIGEKMIKMNKNKLEKKKRERERENEHKNSIIQGQRDGYDTRKKQDQKQEQRHTACPCLWGIECFWGGG